ncbi:hypothetical protein FB451DRAFT_994207, partial [Mycena latifolia]
RALFRAREELTAVRMLTFCPNPRTSRSVRPRARAGCTTLEALQADKAHQKLVRESGVADDYLYDPLCGLQALIDADWAAEGFC